MIRFLLLVLLLVVSTPALAGDANGPVHVSAGTIVDLGIVKSKYADPRRVVVWLPAGYSNHGRKYAVLYMHDGQNLFDKATAGYGMEWEVAEHLSKLIAGRKVRPMIDRSFHVKTDRADTFIMGSSMGSLVSLYAINEYPSIFGGAGMMSTHWPLFMRPDGQSVSQEEYEVVSSAFEHYLATALPDPSTHKLYFDHGSETLDAIYAQYQDRVDRVVERRGYIRGRNWMSLSFPGQKHNEISWASRLDTPLTFLLAP